MTAGMITIVRNACIVAKLVKVKVKVDGQEYGELKENEALTIQLPYGMHHLEMKVAGNPSYHSTFEISEETSGNSYSFKINMIGKPDFGGADPGVAVKTNGNAIHAQAPQKKHGCLLFILIPIAIILVFLIAVLVSGENDGKSANANPTTNNAEPIPSTAVEPTFAPITGEVGDWEVTIEDFQYKDGVSVGFFHEYSSEENSKYCVILVTVKNVGAQADTFLPLFVTGNATTAKIVWNGYEYTRSELLLSKDNLSSETLNPLVSTSGNLAFEVPEELIESNEVPVLVFSAGKSSLSCELIKTVPED